MVEAGRESGPEQPRAKVIKELEVNGRKLAVLKASPRYAESGAKPEGGPTPAPVLFVEGHNPKPKKDDDQVKTGHDIGVLAESIGCDVYSVVRTGEGSDSPRLVKGEAATEGVAVTQLHQAKADEILGAIKTLQADGVLTHEPLDVMGFSDGGIVTLAMLDDRPELFGRFVITNTPGLDNSSTSRSYALGLREIGHLAAHTILQKFGRGGGGYGPQSKLSFTHDTDESYAKSIYTSKPSIETHAIAKTRSLLRLFPHILTRNPNLQGYIVNTENDKIAPADRVESELQKVLPGDSRIQSRRTGWRKHTMGYGSLERAGKLTDQGKLMLELREKVAGNNKP